MSNGKGFGESPNNKEKLTPKIFNKWQKKALMGDIDSQLKVTNFFRNEWNKDSYKPDSTMIHERDYEPMDCFLCGKHMPSIHDTHNPEPYTPRCTAKNALEDNLSHRCCSECNADVSEARRQKKIEEGTWDPNDKGYFHIFDYVNTHIHESDYKKGFIVPFFNEETGKKEELIL